MFLLTMKNHETLFEIYSTYDTYLLIWPII